MLPANPSKIHPSTIKFTNRLFFTLRFEEHRLAFWDSLSEIDRKYLTVKFKNPDSLETDNDAVLLPQANPLILFHALTGKPEHYCLVEVSFRLKLIDSNKKSELLHELFGTDQELKISKSKRKPSFEKPIWSKGDGVLKFNGKIVLKTQVRKKTTIIQVILQAFQDQDWLEKIDDPFFNTLKSDRRFNLVYLNRLSEKSSISFSRSPDRKFIHCHFPIQRVLKSK